MRKGIRDGQKGTQLFTQKKLEQLIGKGYRYVQVKGLTTDYHYDYIEPSRIVLIPLRELPADQSAKDIYEPIDSQLLLSWACERDNRLKMFL